MGTMTDTTDEQMRHAAERALNHPLLAQAADRLHAKYGTLEVAAFRGDENYATVMLRDGRWARYVHGEGWTPLPPLVASIFPCPCTGEIGPCPRCAEGAVDT